MRFRRVISWALAFLALVAMTATAATTATAAPLPTTATTQTSVAATTATTGLCKVSAHPLSLAKPTQTDANIFLFYGRVYSQTDFLSFKVVNQAQIFSRTGNFIDTLNYERFYLKTVNGTKVLGLHRCTGDTLLNLQVSYTDSKGKIRSVRWNGRGTIPVRRAFVVKTTATVQILVVGKLSYVSASLYNPNLRRIPLIFD